MGAANNTGTQISYNPRPCRAPASYMLESKAAILNLSSTRLKSPDPRFTRDVSFNHIL
jgi:hypothetical protein